MPGFHVGGDSKPMSIAELNWSSPAERLARRPSERIDVFRHSTIVALLYALFMEFFLGNVPGIVKRVAVNFYGRSMMYDLGGSEGLVSPDPRLFVPISAQASAYALLAVAFGSLLLGLLIFERREYRDLS